MSSLTCEGDCECDAGGLVRMLEPGDNCVPVLLAFVGAC